MRKLIVLVCVLAITASAFAGIAGDPYGAVDNAGSGPGLVGVKDSSAFVNSTDVQSGVWGDLQYNWGTDGTDYLTALQSDLGSLSFTNPQVGGFDGYSTSGGTLSYVSDGYFGTEGAYTTGEYGHGFAGTQPNWGTMEMSSHNGYTSEFGNLAISAGAPVTEWGFYQRDGDTVVRGAKYAYFNIDSANGTIIVGDPNKGGVVLSAATVGDLTVGHDYRVAILGHISVTDEDPNLDDIVRMNFYMDGALLAEEIYAGLVPDPAAGWDSFATNLNMNEANFSLNLGREWDSSETYYDWSLDYVHIDADAWAPVPEPATMLLLLGGGLLGLKRRKK